MTQIFAVYFKQSQSLQFSLGIGYPDIKWSLVTGNDFECVLNGRNSLLVHPEKHDIDECAEDSKSCPMPYSTCNNTIGSYSCGCEADYFPIDNSDCTYGKH